MNAVTIRCGNCKQDHDSVAAVRDCYGVAAAMPTRPVIDVHAGVYPATEKQVNFILRLAKERRWAESDTPTADLVETVVAGKAITKKEASEAITFLQGCARNEAEPVVRVHGNQVLDLGMYRKDGKIFRVYPARNGGHLLCKELVGDYDEPNDFHFVYRGGPSRNGLRPEHKMTLEQAREFGAQFGVCCVCGALLTDPTSVAAGIGPVCGARDEYFA